MSEETINRLREMFKGKWKSENPRQHIGLYNSFQRLRYYYGQEAQIAVEQTADGYTTFRIQIPYSLEVYDEMIDGNERRIEEEYMNKSKAVKIRKKIRSKKPFPIT